MKKRRFPAALPAIMAMVTFIVSGYADWEKVLQINPNHADARNNLEALRGMGY
jgi:hypothetical protein